MSYKCFENKECEFYPCHKIDKINCLFCFCPLYLLNCSGNYEMISDKDGKLIKDCSNCVLPHIDGGYERIIECLKGK